jgi:hypothetical protein
MMYVDENDIVRITVALPRDVVGRLDTYAHRNRWSRSTAAAALIEQGLPAGQGQDAGQGDHVESR